jgi:type I restriction enzyme S subunit
LLSCKQILGKFVKKAHNPHYEKIEDEPFEIPENWCWTKFGDCINVINGKNQSAVIDPEGHFPIYGSGGIMGRANSYLCPENCTIIGRKGSINNPIFVSEKFWNVDTAFGLCPSGIVLPKYLYFFCLWFDFSTLDNSTTLPSLTKTSIQQIPFVLAPLKEQSRIVAKIEELFSTLDQMERNLV